MRTKGREGVTLHQGQGGCIARLHGELDLYTIPAFESLLFDALVGGEGYFAVDLNHLDFMDSQGIHMLSRIRDFSAEMDRRFYLVCGEGPCRRVLDAVGADKIFNLRAACEEVEGG